MDNHEISPSNNEPLNDYSQWIDINEKLDEVAEQKRQLEQDDLKKLMTEATASGKEPFDAAKVVECYYPNDNMIFDDPIKLLEYAQNYISDYYRSNVMSIEEWAKQREEYDVIKDSTGSE